MVGVIKTISSGMKSTSADMFLDSTTMSSPCAMKRVLKAAAQVERAALCMPPSAPRHVHSRVYAVWTQSEDLSVFLAFTRNGLRLEGHIPVSDLASAKPKSSG